MVWVYKCMPGHEKFSMRNASRECVCVLGLLGCLWYGTDKIYCLIQRTRNGTGHDER